MTFGISGNGLSACALAGALALAPTVHAQGVADMKRGGSGSTVQGAAGPGGAQDASSALERCEKPMATVAVADPSGEILKALTPTVGSLAPLIRIMIQQSNCFLVVERSVGLQNISKEERELARAGVLRQGSNVGGGQMIPIDYILTPAVVFSGDNVGGGHVIGSVIGGLFGSGGARLGTLVGGAGVQVKEAQTSMMLTDARSSVQVAAAEGSAKKADFSAGESVPKGASAGFGGFWKTAAGKVLAASLAENYNGIVRAVRGDPSLQRNVATLATEAATITKVGAFSEGDLLRPKIAGVRVLAKPSDPGDAVATLAREDELIFTGQEQDGFVSVETAKGGGWVKKILVTK
jgi:hypothetical protein